MKRIAAAVLAATILLPAGQAIAGVDEISDRSTALQRAGRVGNAVSIAARPPTPVTDNPFVGVKTSANTVTGVTDEMQAVLDLVNVERTSRGLAPVRFSALLNEAALAHTIAQAADGTIYHVDPDTGANPGDRIARVGYRFNDWGENVGAGHRTPERLIERLMLSPPHCKTILNPSFTELGVGHVTGGLFYDNFWTQAFARPSTEPRPAGVYNPDWC